MAVAQASYKSINIANNISRQDMAAFRPREWRYPYPVNENPFYSDEENEGWFHSWLVKTEVDKVLSPTVFERFVKANLPLFNRFSHPNTAMGEWGYKWTSKFLAYLVIIDDVNNEPEVGHNPEAVLHALLDENLVMLWSFPDDPQLFENTKTLVHMGTPSQKEIEEKMSDIEDLLTEARSHPGKAYPREVVTVCKCFLDLWADALEKSSPVSMLLVGQATQVWMIGNLEEAVTRRKERSVNSLTLQDYIEMRRRSGALYCLLVEREIASGFRTPIHWFESPAMRRILVIASDLISWDNDLLSFAKELLVDKDVTGNVLVAVSKYKSVNFERAVEVLHKMMDDRMVDLEEAFAELEKTTPPDLTPNFHIYVQALQDLLIGTHTWCSVSKRYTEY